MEWEVYFLIPQGTLTTFASNLKETIGGVGLAIVQAGTHAISQGVLGLMQGGDFMSSAAGGFFGSLGAELWGGAMKGLGYEKFAGSTMGTVTFGALSGGIGAELSGGNFWQGAVTGGIVAGLNHVAHKEINNKLQQQQEKTIESLLKELSAEKKGAILTGKEIKSKYGLKQNINRAISKIEVLGNGSYRIEWNNTFLINQATVLNVKDGNVSIKPLKISNKIGYQISGSGIKAKIEGIEYSTIFLDGNYVYGLNKDKKLTAGYGF